MRPAPQESVIMASGSPNVGAAGGGGGGIKPQLVSNQMSHSISKIVWLTSQIFLP